MENMPATTNPSQPPAVPDVNTGAPTPPPPPEAPKRRLPPFLQGLVQLSMLRQIGLFVALAAAIALGIGMVIWTQQTPYKPLLSSASPFETRDVIELLQGQNIDFNIDPVSGTLLVAEADLHKARLAVASAGLQTQQVMGYELLDEQPALGTSQFMENARYRRSVEGELARTIASIQQVRAARVHLAIPEKSVFVRDQRHASASVFVDLIAGQALSIEQVKAITNMVANSVPDMDAGSVSVVDQKGRLLSDYESRDEQAQTDRQLEYQSRVEEQLRQRITNILGPVIGEAFQAQVNANIDFTQREQAEELFNPDLIALRSEQTISEQRVGDPEGGIPGALTNEPPGQAQAPEEAGEGGAGAGVPSTRRDEATRNFEVDRTLSFTNFAQGRIDRLTVAVVVDDLKVADPETGEMVNQPWPEEELAALRALVRDAVGFDAARGDSIEVINATFRADPVTFEEVPFYTQPWFWEIMRQILIGLFLLILVFGVLRPVYKRLTDAGKDDEEEKIDAVAELDFDEESLGDDKVTLSLGEEYLLPGPSEGFERQLDALRGLIAEDPGRVSLVLKHWIMSDD